MQPNIKISLEAYRVFFIVNIFLVLLHYIIPVIQYKIWIYRIEML